MAGADRRLPRAAASHRTRRASHRKGPRLALMDTRLARLRVHCRSDWLPRFEWHRIASHPALLRRRTQREAQRCDRSAAHSRAIFANRQSPPGNVLVRVVYCSICIRRVCAHPSRANAMCNELLRSEDSEPNASGCVCMCVRSDVDVVTASGRPRQRVHVLRRNVEEAGPHSYLQQERADGHVVRVEQLERGDRLLARGHLSRVEPARTRPQECTRLKRSESRDGYC